MFLFGFPKKLGINSWGVKFFRADRSWTTMIQYKTTILVQYTKPTQNEAPNTLSRLTLKVLQGSKLSTICSKISTFRDCEEVPSLKLTARTWKWLIGRLLSFWECPFSGAMLVLGRVKFSIHFQRSTAYVRKKKLRNSGECLCYQTLENIRDLQSFYRQL